MSAFLQHCDELKRDVVCTDEFVMHNITVLDQDGVPADSVEITVVDKQKDERLEICPDEYCYRGEEGIYTIMHDGFHGKLEKRYSAFELSGVKGDLSFSQGYIFKDGPCHVQKMAGPDTVSLSP